MKSLMGIYNLRKVATCLVSRPVLAGLAILCLPLTGIAAEPAAPPPVVHKVEYQVTLPDDAAAGNVPAARIVAQIDVESTARSTVVVPLFDGGVTLPAAPRLPRGLRLVREGTRMDLVIERSGRYQFPLELVADTTARDLSREVTFRGPAAVIGSLSATAARPGMEIQLVTGTVLESGGGSDRPFFVRGFLGADPTVTLRWQSRTASASRQVLATCESTTQVSASPTVIRSQTRMAYEILQGTLSNLSIALPARHALTKVEAEGIRDWQIRGEDSNQVLVVELVRAAEKSFEVRLQLEQPVNGAPAEAEILPPRPLNVSREGGQIVLAAEDVLVETRPVAALRQVNAPSGALAAFRFFGPPSPLPVTLRRIEPVLGTSDRVTVRLEETRLLVRHQLGVNVDKAGLYNLTLVPPAGFNVTEVKGEGVEDWSTREGLLRISLGSRVLGNRAFDILLEQSFKQLPARIELAPLILSNAVRQTAQIGAAAIPGIQLKTATLSGLREIPVSTLPSRTDELLAFTADQSGWSLALSTERLAPRVVADILNLITIGDGLVGGSASIRYAIVNQGVQEFKVRLPMRFRNVDFTGPNIRRKDVQPAPGDTNAVLWTIGLQDKAWNAYTLVVTYDFQFDPHQARLALGGVHAMEVEREAGSFAIMSGANLQLRESLRSPGLRRVDETEMADTDRALITRAVLLAYQYAGTEPVLGLDVTRFDEAKVLDAVADRTQLTSVLTDQGQMLSQASFMVKNNDKQFQKFFLPAQASFWGCYVNGQAAKAEVDGGALLVPLPRQADRDESFAVDIVYAQTNAALAKYQPQPLQLAAPRTDVQNTYAEWELFIPDTHELSAFGGNMTPDSVTRYTLADAWREFANFYTEHRFDAVRIVFIGIVVMGVLWVLGLIIRSVGGGRQEIRRAGITLVELFVVVLIIGILSGLLLPALATAKRKAQRINSANNLKQIGLALKLYAGDHEGKYPSRMEQMLDELGTEKLLTDPECGERFAYLGAGLKETDVDANSFIIAYSPSGVNGHRNVLMADGSVQMVGETRFSQMLSESVAGQRKLPIGAAALTVVTGQAGGFGGGGANAVVPQQAFQPAVAAAPRTAGIRSIHIDIPRTGHRYMFTKVLNVRDEALTVNARIATRTARNFWGSIVRGCLFMAGLAFVWWQWRNTSRCAFRITLGCALMAGAVAWHLLAYRWLGVVMVHGAPVLAGLLALRMLYIIWPRRKAQPRPPVIAPSDFDGDSSGDPEPPVPGPGPVVVAALLACLLSMSAAQAAPVGAEAAKTSEPTPAITVLTASYTGAVRGRVADLEAELILSAPAIGKSGVFVPLFGDDVTVRDCATTPKNAGTLARENGFTGVRLTRRGETTVRVKLLATVSGDSPGRRLAFNLPAALTSRAVIQLDQPGASVELAGAIQVNTSAVQQATRVEALLGAQRRFDLQWSPRTRTTEQTPSTVFCRNLAVVRFAGGVQNVRASLGFQITQGELRQARVLIPSGSRLLRVEGDAIRTWHTTATNADEILLVELSRAQTAEWWLTVEMESPLPGLPADVSVRLPQVLDVVRESGFVAFAASEDLNVMPEAAAGLQKVDAAEFLKARGLPANAASATAYAAVFQFFRGGTPVPGRIEPLQPRIEAVVRNHTRVGAEQVTLSTRVDYTIKRAGVFTLRMGLPADYRVESVARADSGDPIAQWIEQTNSGVRILEVTLKQRTLGTLSLRVQMVRSGAAIEPGMDAGRPVRPVLDIHGVHPLDVQKLSGFVTVATDTGIQARTLEFEGINEVPASSVPESRGGLAFKFLCGEPVPAALPWRLSVTLEAVGAWVRAEIINWLDFKENLVNGRTLVQFEVQNAPTREFQIRIPPALRNVEISGANIRRQDRDGDLWRIELQNRIVGNYPLTVTWELPWDGTNKSGLVEFSGISTDPRNVERETGMVLVNARPPLSVASQAASPEMLRTDTRDLPGWAGSASDATVLAYRYLRPGYKLALAVKQHDPAEVLDALADSVRMTTVVADDGQVMTGMTLALRNNGRQYLDLALPAGSEVWSAFVAGQPVRPCLRNGRLLIPLENSVNDAPVSVELTYVGAVPFPKMQGGIELVSPALDVPLKDARWELYLPPDFDYSKFEGTMKRQDNAAAPVVFSFSTLVYSQAESKSRVERERNRQVEIARARVELSRGNVKGANYYMNSVNNSTDQQADKDVDDLKRNLRQAQGSNLIKAQRQIAIDNSSTLFNNLSQQPMQQQILEPQGQIAQWENEAAEKQWAKLEKAQEVAGTKVRPLRVNLPTRGQKLDFSQALQTETGRPLTIRLHATSTRLTPWLLYVEILCGAFALLWITVALFRFKRRPAAVV
jgi:competence protein ComGC